jgi:hypothetical protein
MLHALLLVVTEGVTDIITNLRPIHSNVSLKNNDLNKIHHM